MECLYNTSLDEKNESQLGRGRIQNCEQLPFPSNLYSVNVRIELFLLSSDLSAGVVLTQMLLHMTD